MHRHREREELRLHVTFLAAVAALAAGPPGCADEHESTAEAGRATSPLEEAAPTSEGVRCGQLEGVPELTIALAGGGEIVDFSLDRGASLELLVANRGARSGSARIRVRSSSEAGDATAVGSRFDLPARTEDTALVASEDLGLPLGALEYSGSIAIRVELALNDGSVRRSPDLALFFHPTDRGWQLYDVNSRDQNWAFGAIGQQAQDRVDSVLDRVPGDAVLGSVGRARVELASVDRDWRPTPDAPGDPEAGGDR